MIPDCSMTLTLKNNYDIMQILFFSSMLICIFSKVVKLNFRYFQRLICEVAGLLNFGYHRSENFLKVVKLEVISASSWNKIFVV